MREFDRRWRLLVRAASRAGEAPIPDVPDGAFLRRRAAAAGGAVKQPWGHAWTSSLAVALLWAVTIPVARPAWQAARDVLARLGESAPAPTCCSALPAPAIPEALSAPNLALPRRPPLPEFLPRLLPRLRWADPAIEAPPKETPS